MTYDELMRGIVAELPQLEGNLSEPKAVYVREQNKCYVTYHSRVLVEEATFLRFERLLQKRFPTHRLALRVVSPELKDAFLADIGTYKQVLLDFLRRNYPASQSWIDSIDWRCAGNTITLTFPDDFSMHYMGRQNVQARLAQAVKDIFSAEVRVELAVAGDQEARLAKMREERLQNQVTAVTLETAPAAPKPKAHRDPDKPAAERPRRDPAEKKEAKKEEAFFPQMTDKALDRPILGRAIGDHPIEMKTLSGDSGLCVVQGDIFKLETKELRGGETLLVTFAITDYTSSILCKAFMRYRKNGFRRGGDNENTELPPITEEERKAVNDRVARIKMGMNVKVRGECRYDAFSRELAITVRDMVPMERIEREDTAEEKRIELHMHTNKSTMDALAPAEQLIARAAKWGHPAVAITDHGVVQAFPEAFKAAKNNKIKLIPGCEGYLIDDTQIVADATDAPLDTPVVVLDFEATGLNTVTSHVIEIGAVKLVNGTVADSMSVLVNPHEPLKPKIVELTGITDVMLADGIDASKAIPDLLAFIGDCPLAAHNASYDIALLHTECHRLGLEWNGPVIDTLTFSRKLYP